MALNIEADRFFGPRRPLGPILPFDSSRSVRTMGGLSLNSKNHNSESVKLHLTSSGAGQAFLVAQANWGVKAAAVTRAAYDEIARVLQDQGLSMVHERLFGSLKVKAEVMSARNASFRASGFPVDGPLTYIQGRPPWGEGFAGVIIQAVKGDAVWTIEDKGKKVGTGWRRGDATFLVLQNLQGQTQNGNGADSHAGQTRRLIQRAARLLKAEGTSFQDVVRTWFYLSDILAWYPEFNRARTDIYKEFGILPGQNHGQLRLPASTGIRGEVPGAAVAAMDLLAVAGPAKSRPLVRQLSNPGQQDAFQYGSAFSRGALIRQSDFAIIQVSGTAAIDEQGRSLYPGDVRVQIDCTFDKIAALIGQEGASLQDIAAACVFVKRPEDALVYQERARALGLDNLPAVVMVADICRPELLFEIDAEVVIEPGRRRHE
jgi:enamine deaminase RidA (YjgF/YER057c/UK114 family)